MTNQHRNMTEAGNRVTVRMASLFSVSKLLRGLIGLPRQTLSPATAAIAPSIAAPTTISQPRVSPRWLRRSSRERRAGSQGQAHQHPIRARIFHLVDGSTVIECRVWPFQPLKCSAGSHGVTKVVDHLGHHHQPIRMLTARLRFIRGATPSAQRGFRNPERRLRSAIEKPWARSQSTASLGPARHTGLSSRMSRRA